MSYAERTSLQVAIVPLPVGDQSSETAAEYCSELADITTAKNEYHLCKWKKLFLISFPSILRQNIARSESTSQEPGQKLQDIGTNITHTSFVGGKSKTIKVFSSVGECLAKMFCQQLSGENKSGLGSNGLAAKSSFGQCMLFRRIVAQLYWVLSLDHNLPPPR